VTALRYHTVQLTCPSCYEPFTKQPVYINGSPFCSTACSTRLIADVIAKMDTARSVAHLVSSL
jgi:hypothetical protein